MIHFPPDYFAQLRAAREDLLGIKLLHQVVDPGYEEVAGYLAPCQAYTFLGTPESKEKWIIEPDGRIGVLAEKVLPPTGLRLGVEQQFLKVDPGPGTQFCHQFVVR